MAKYVTKPPVVDAVRWDGSVEGLDELRAFIRGDEHPYAEFKWTIDGLFKDDVTQSKLLLESLPMIEGRNAYKTMYAGDFLIRDENGNYAILDETLFNRRYERESE
jgi:hypothetical protein